MAKTKFTFAQFKELYPNDDACLLAILQRRYPSIDACPNCGVVGKLTRIEGRRAFACKEGCHIYPCAGTIFEHSPTNLTKWFHAMYLMTATRNGIAAKEIERQLGVTYKCAWRIGHQLRELMAARDKANTPEQLGGHTEIDEAYVGGHRRMKYLGDTQFDNKTAVVGMVERGGALKAQVVPDTKKDTLVPLVLQNVAPGTTVSTDEAHSYKDLRDHGYEHGRVHHARMEWVRQYWDSDVKFSTNTMEGFWAHLKNGIRSTHIHVSPQHLQKYVGEFQCRYNNRHEPAEMFHRIPAQISKPAT
jgi:transposase